jgi:iron complex transport system substrate-binding protein
MRKRLMHRKVALAVAIIVAFAGSYLGKKLLQHEAAPISNPLAASDSQDRVPQFYRRIVSLAPSITETLFILGVMDRIVGVTRYCDFPPEALAKTEIGGYYDPNYEAIVALNPDLIIMLVEHEGPKQHLNKLGLATLVVDHRSVSGILNSIQTIGRACGVEEKAESIVADIRERINRIRQKTVGLPRSRVLISVGRNMGSGSLRDIYISGRDDFYDEMISLAGGINAYEGNVAFPIVSGEGIIQMNPEVVIDMVPDLDRSDWDEAMVLEEWKAVSNVAAVKNGRVHVFGEGFVVIPGPRFILILEKIARALYPGADWE